ncbi:hypothetical protein GCM10007907_33150 [Chitinimonas prasina]|uniref:Secreted protein n=1 Tax=Chitinimonas prasina TaxID=1434937 RepID=A0ABQ5YHP7_9NEIS|nr:hypothetical protein GCM10007907_33150 [Chitinimonas prasina]
MLQTGPRRFSSFNCVMMTVGMMMFINRLPIRLGLFGAGAAVGGTESIGEWAKFESPTVRLYRIKLQLYAL